METAVWTTIGLLAATSLGTRFYLGARLDALGARVDVRFDSLEGRADALAARFDVRFDSFEARLDPRFEALESMLDIHLERHAR